MAYMVILISVCYSWLFHCDMEWDKCSQDQWRLPTPRPVRIPYFSQVSSGQQKSQYKPNTILYLHNVFCPIPNQAAYVHSIALGRKYICPMLFMSVYAGTIFDSIFSLGSAFTFHCTIGSPLTGCVSALINSLIYC